MVTAARAFLTVSKYCPPVSPVQVVSAILRGARRSHPGTPPAARWRLRRPEPTVKRIKARDHFGLRGTRH
jgi:hypothetical protein